MKRQNKNSGFSEIELVTFIVLITVIVVLVRTCEDRAHMYKVHDDIAQFTKIRTAISQFKAQYGLLPGDFNDAKKLWPECADINSLKMSCNGNGDGFWDNNEDYYVFEHLTHAKLLDEKYSASPDVKDEDAAKNIFPVVAVTGQSIVPVGSFGGDAQKQVSDMFYKYKLPENSFMIYFESNSAGDPIPTQNKIETIMVQQIDEKMDDGIASKGNIRAANDRTGFFGAYTKDQLCVTPKGEYKDDEDNLYYCSFIVRY